MTSAGRAATAAAVSESAFEFGGALGIAALSTLLGSSAVSPGSVQRDAPTAFFAGALALLLALSVATGISTTEVR